MKISTDINESRIAIKNHLSFHVLDVTWEDHMNYKFSLKKK